MPQIYEVLKQEHKEVTQMLEQMTSNGKPGKRDIDKLYKMLESHTKAEEKTLYKDLEQAKQTQELTLEAIEEHHVADVLLKEIRRLERGDKRLSAKMMVLKENVEHHIEEEEKKLFPQAKAIKDKMWAEDMAQQFEKQEASIKKRMK